MSNPKKRKRDDNDLSNDKASGPKKKTPKLTNSSPSTQSGASDFEKDDCVYISSRRPKALCKSTSSQKTCSEDVKHKNISKETINGTNSSNKRIKKEFNESVNSSGEPTKQTKIEHQKSSIKRNARKNSQQEKQFQSRSNDHTSTKLECNKITSNKDQAHEARKHKKDNVVKKVQNQNETEAKKLEKTPKAINSKNIKVKEEPKWDDGKVHSDEKTQTKLSIKPSVKKEKIEVKKEKKSDPLAKKILSKRTKVKEEPKWDDGKVLSNGKSMTKVSRKPSVKKEKVEVKKEKKSNPLGKKNASERKNLKKEPGSSKLNEVQPVVSSEQSFTQDNIMEMLRCLEGSQSTSAKSSKTTKTETNKVPKLKVTEASDIEEMEDSDTESESDWEEVEGERREEKSQLPDGPVEITLDAPLLMNRKKRKRGFDMEAWFQRQVNRHQREAQVLMHKVHLLCLLCHGFHLNQICNSHLLLSVALSLVPSESLRTKLENYTMNVLSRLVKWYVSLFKIDSETEENMAEMEETLLKRLGSRKLASEREMVLIFIIMLRALGVDSRLVYSMQPISHKPNLKSIKNVSRQKATEIEVIDIDENSKNSEDMNKVTDKERFTTPPATPSSSKTETKAKRKRLDKNQKVESKVKRSKNREHSSDSEDERRKKSKGKRPVKSKYWEEKKKKSQLNTDEDVQVVSSGSEFEGEKSFRISPSYKNKLKNGKGKKTKIVSSDSEDDIEITKAKIKSKGTDFWVEVFLETEQKWICVDCIKAKVNCHGEMESRATKPISYILAYDNNNCVKDVTQRYANNWVSHTRKNRVEEEWWEDTLNPYDTKDENKKEKEDMQLQAQMIKRPLPTSIAEFKNHPLYALKRHLLKFEAIYPDTSIPVGYIRGEPVYARDCVHTLRSRETWLREARCVRLGETPYKLVKARKKMRGPAPSTDEPTLEVFGIWQTEDYIPPPAVDGKVPKNEYGNVEVYKECMIPGGTVHLKVPALNKVAKKLNIDIAPAMVGWDQHGGFPHPILDGWIVCEEHKDILLAAWDEEQEIIKEKEAEKRDKRVYGNWKTLIKGLLIKERIKNRYDLEEKLTPKKKTQGKEEVANDVAMSWPQNKQTKKTSTKKKSKKNDGLVIPIEEL